MSDTPRTDAIMSRPHMDEHTECVFAELARQLERELADARAIGDLLRKAAKFGLLTLRESRDELADLDGGWLQDTAEECGLLERIRVSEPCGEGCRCVEYHGCEDFPVDCLRMTPECLQMEKDIHDRP